jgi:hypothetical protein
MFLALDDELCEDRAVRRGRCGAYQYQPYIRISTCNRISFHFEITATCAAGLQASETKICAEIKTGHEAHLRSTTSSPLNEAYERQTRLSVRRAWRLSPAQRRWIRVPALSIYITKLVRTDSLGQILRGHRKGMKMMGEETYRSSRNNLSRRSIRWLLSRSNSLPITYACLISSEYLA